MTKNIRRCSGAVVYKNDGNDGLLILLVKNTSGKSWGFPKGGVEPDLTPQQNAVKEVWEEAGIIGVLGERLTSYRYKKDGVEQFVRIFSMHATVELEDYPEVATRKRKWFTLDQARAKLNKQLRQALVELEAWVRD